MKKGFTLIELLVVILIIGILAAVALPQYQMAVKKAKLMDSLIQVDAGLKAAKIYWLTYGSWPDNLDQLDIGTQGCQLWTNHTGAANESFVFSCGGARGTIYTSNPERAIRFCVAKNYSSLSQEVCKKFTGLSNYSEAILNLLLYRIP